MDRVSIARRINNNKRGYLIVNSHQGKHKIALISTVINEYDNLAKAASKNLDRALIIGFAETAVAIGAKVAGENENFFMQTTREDVVSGNEDYINFTEAHSHATGQRLVRADLEKIYDKVDKIVFVEDEITTGNTISHCIEEIENIFKGNKKYCIAAIINSLSKERREFFIGEKIDISSLVDIETHSFEEDVKDIIEDGNVYKIYSKGDKENEIKADILKARGNVKREIIFKSNLKTRRLMNIRELNSEVKRLEEYLEEKYFLKKIIENVGTITVLGSEEFTYVPIKLAEYMDLLTGESTNVYTHSTTRSPIMVSKREGYPFHTRYEVRSLYEGDRQTYIYDLMKSDVFFLVTDGSDKEGMDSVLEAIRLSGNENVYVIRWDNEQQL